MGAEPRARTAKSETARGEELGCGDEEHDRADDSACFSNCAFNTFFSWKYFSKRLPPVVCAAVYLSEETTAPVCICAFTWLLTSHSQLQRRTKLEPQ